VVTKQWDEQGEKNVMVFSALSEKGIAIWGSGLNAIE
jgi:arabinan endo-1,5-alpha-L-arabinosidase